MMWDQFGKLCSCLKLLEVYREADVTMSDPTTPADTQAKAPQSDAPPIVDAELSCHPHVELGKRRLLVVMALLFVLAGAIPPWLPESMNLPFNKLAFIYSLLLLLWWYDLDQLGMGRRPTFSGRFSLIVCPGPVFGLPLHFIATRGKRGWRWIARATCFAAMVCLLYFCAKQVSRWLVQ